jgi:hypothetical protein
MGTYLSDDLEEVQKTLSPSSPTALTTEEVLDINDAICNLLLVDGAIRDETISQFFDYISADEALLIRPDIADEWESELMLTYYQKYTKKKKEKEKPANDKSIVVYSPSGKPIYVPTQPKEDKKPIPINQWQQNQNKWQQTETKVHKPYRACHRQSLTLLSGKDLGWRVYMNRAVYRKLWAYWYMSPTEISGLGLLKFSRDPRHDVKDWRCRIVDVDAMSHTNGRDAGASSHLLGDQIAKYFIDLNAAGKDLEMAGRFWWHSHVHIGTFFSTTDVQDWIDDTLAEQRVSALIKSGWIMSLVVSGHGEDMTMGMRVDGWFTKDDDPNPENPTIWEWAVGDIPLIVPQIPDTIEKKVIVDMAKNRRTTPIYQTPSYVSPYTPPNPQIASQLAEQDWERFCY